MLGKKLMTKNQKLILLGLLTCLVVTFSVLPALNSLLLITRASATGEPWLQGWQYRKAHYFSDNDYYANYQVRIKVYYGSGYDSGNTVYCNSHCQTDFDDIRFTDDDGTTPLDQWRESYVTGSYAYFWVKIPYISANYGAIVYLYYDNPSAQSASDGDATFIFFDDFSGSSLDSSKWDYQTGDPNDVTVSNGYLYIYSDPVTSQRVIYNAKATYEVAYDVAITVRSATLHSNDRWCPMVHLRQRGATYNYEAARLYSNTDSQGYLRTSNEGSSSTTSYSGLSLGSWHRRTLTWEPSKIQYYQDEACIGQQTYNVPDEYLVPGFWAGDTPGRTEYVRWDWVHLRKWESTEPIHVSWGPEMSLPNGRTYDTSPYSWVLKWKYDNIDDQYVLDVTDVKFDAAAINWYHFYGGWPFLYKYTKDVRELSYGGYKVSSNGYWSTNLPGPWFDRDDDNLDGYYEEAEITAYYYWALQEDYAYNSHFGFDTHSTGWTKIQHSSQISYAPLPPADPISVLSDVLQNFEVYISQTTGQGVRVLAPGTISLLDWLQETEPKHQETFEEQIVYAGSLTNQCLYTIIEKASGNRLVKIWPTLSNRQDFNQHTSWLSARINELAETSSEDSIPVVITFNQPVPMEEMAAVVIEHNIDVTSFEVKVLTSQGEEWTIGGTPSGTALIQQEKFNTMLKCIQEDTGDDNLQVAGIYALWGTVASASLKSLQSDALVLLVDVSPAVVLQEVQQLGFTGSLRFSSTDLYETARHIGILET